MSKIVSESLFVPDNEQEYITRDSVNIIKNFSYDQTEILYNIGMLYNNGSCQFDCDITASQLGFYNGGSNYEYAIPEPKILMDVFPQREDIIKLDKWGKIPLEDSSIHSIVIDLPFVMTVPGKEGDKPGNNLTYKRFSGYYPEENLYYSYYHWLSEASRVLDEDGLCIFKCQSSISSSIRHNIEEFSFMAAQRLGFTMEDKFTLLAKSRLINYNDWFKHGQVHSRSYTSMFLVFIKKLNKKKKEFNYEELLDVCREKELDGYTDIVEK